MFNMFLDARAFLEQVLLKVKRNRFTIQSTSSYCVQGHDVKVSYINVRNEGVTTETVSRSC